MKYVKSMCINPLKVPEEFKKNLKKIKRSIVCSRIGKFKIMNISSLPQFNTLPIKYPLLLLKKSR